MNTQDNQSLGTLVADLAQQVSTLVQTEARLLRAELSESVTKAEAGAVGVLGGAVCLLAALMVLLQALAEGKELVIDERIDGVQHIKRHVGVAIGVGKAEPLQRADDRIVHAALHDDADRAIVRPKDLVDLAALDEIDRRRPALCDLLLLVQEGGRRQHDAAGVAARGRQRIGNRHRRPLVILGDEVAMDVAAADAHLQHDRRVGGLRQLEAILDRLDDRGQVRARIEQPDLALHGEGVAALLHDGGALAIVLA
ncbi:MAG: phage holin family protein, partial [Mesorhizobium sp.]